MQTPGYFIADQAGFAISGWLASYDAARAARDELTSAGCSGHRIEEAPVEGDDDFTVTREREDFAEWAASASAFA